MEEEALLTVQEAAELLGTRDQTVYDAIREERLPYVVKYGRKLVSRQAIEVYKERTRPTGEKPKGRPPGSSSKKKV